MLRDAFFVEKSVTAGTAYVLNTCALHNYSMNLVSTVQVLYDTCLASDTFSFSMRLGS